MSKRNDFIFKVLRTVAWVIFVGFCIEAGALIVSFVFSLLKPEIISHLYQKSDLSEIYSRSKWVFYSMYGFAMTISILKAFLFYAVIKLITKLNLVKPFSSYVAAQVAQISYYTLSVGILSFIARQTAKNLMHQGFEIDILNNFWEDSQAFILMAAVIYIIAAIFSKGVELQKENDLTV